MRDGSTPFGNTIGGIVFLFFTGCALLFLSAALLHHVQVTEPAAPAPNIEATHD